MTTKRPKLKYWVYYELEERDCEPELMGKTETLAEAWAMVWKAFLDAHEACPEDCGHPGAIPRYKTRQLMPKEAKEGFFEMPEEGAALSAKKPTWIAVGHPDTYFVFPGSWYEHCDEEFDQLVNSHGKNVTVVHGV